MWGLWASSVAARRIRHRVMRLAGPQRSLRNILIGAPLLDMRAAAALLLLALLGLVLWSFTFRTVTTATPAMALAPGIRIDHTANRTAQ